MRGVVDFSELFNAFSPHAVAFQGLVDFVYDEEVFGAEGVADAADDFVDLAGGALP